MDRRAVRRDCEGRLGNVGNSNTSAINNAGSFVLNTGGTVNLGPNASPGLFTNNTGGIFQANGTAFVRLTVAGGTLTGSGTINALASSSVVIGSGGRLAPGNSPGTITIGGGLDIGGTLELDIANGGGNNSNGSTTPGVGFDTITVSPPPSTPNTSTNVTIRTATTNFVLKTGDANQAAFNANIMFWNTQQKWAFLRTTNGAIIFKDANDNVVASPVAATVALLDSNGGSLSIANYPNSSWMFEDVVASDNTFNRQFNLVWNPVPEPTTWIGISTTAMIALGWFRQKRKVNEVIPYF